MSKRRLLGSAVTDIIRRYDRRPEPRRGSWIREMNLADRQQTSACLPSQRLSRSSTRDDTSTLSSVSPGKSALARQTASPCPSISETATSALSNRVRRLMRLVTHSVFVCTASQPTSSGAFLGTLRAMTMSSFTSLSLRPTPLVTFHIATPSRTLDALEASRQFCVHILAGDPSGARVADCFTQGNAEPGATWAFEVEQGGRAVRLALSGCEVDIEGKNAEEPPVLRGKGVLAVFKCRLIEEPMGGLISVQDHVIVIGEVLEVLDGAPDVLGSNERGRRFGLVYADREYRQLGSTIEKKGEDTR